MCVQPKMQVYSKKNINTPKVYTPRPLICSNCKNLCGVSGHFVPESFNKDGYYICIKAALTPKEEGEV